MPKSKFNRSAFMKQLWAGRSEESKAAINEAISIAHHHPVTVAMKSARMKRQWEQGNSGLGMTSAKAKELWRNPSIRKNRIIGLNKERTPIRRTEEFCRQQSARQKLEYAAGRRKLAGVALTGNKRVSVLELRLKAKLTEQCMKFIHQFPVPNTRYSADFYFPKVKLIVEVDGHPAHYSTKGILNGRRRDTVIREQGFEIMHLRQKHLRDVSKCVGRILVRIKELMNVG